MWQQLSRLVCVGLFAAGACANYPWHRVPLKASPGIDRLELVNGNRSSGTLTSAEIAWLASHHDLIILSVATQDPLNTSVCGELVLADTARRLKQANTKVRVFVYFPSSKDETAVQPGDRPGPQHRFCGEQIFSAHPEWRYKAPNGSDWINSDNSYVHDLTQPAVRSWWIAAATNESFFEHFDGVFADNAIANDNQLMTADHQRLSKNAGKTLLAGQQALYIELRQRLAALGGNRSVIFNGIREGQQFAAIPNLLPYADGGEMEGFLNGIHQRFPNGSLNPALVLPTMHALLNVSAQHPEKAVLLKTAPNGEFSWAEARKRAFALTHYEFSLAAFLVLAGPRWLLDFTWGYRSADYVPPIDNSGTVPGLPRLQSSAPLGWYPDFLQSPGTPLGGATFDGAFTFSREWSGLSVTLNVKDESAKITWKK